MTTHETTIEATQDVAERLQTEVAPALAALAAAQTGSGDDSETVYCRLYNQASLVCSLSNSGAFKFARGADVAGGSELVIFSPRETLALAAFWRYIALGEVVKAGHERLAAERKLVQVLDDRRQERRHARAIGLSAPADLDPDILTRPPRIVMAPDGTRMVQLHGRDGWAEQGPVTDVARLDSFGLALVGTPETVYLMHAADVPV